MALPPIEGRTPRQERRIRRVARQNYKARGQTFPRLATIGFVELTAIKVPEWAWAKKIPGLEDTDRSVWLRRILARELFREDEDAGGSPKITFTYWRPCKICKRSLIGPEAEHRWDLDRKWEGSRIPCSPDCCEVEASHIEFRQQLKTARQRKGN